MVFTLDERRALEDLKTGLAGIDVQKKSATVTVVRPANATPYTAKDAYGVDLVITDATNVTPIVITCATHSLADGDPVTVTSVVGNTAANGNFYAKVTGYSATTFALYSNKALTTPVAGNGAYVSGGHVATLFRFTNLARAAALTGSVIKATILTDQTANVETFRLHLFNAPPTIILDNAPCTAPLFADAAKYQWHIQFPAASNGGSGSNSAYAICAASTASSNLPLDYKCGTADTDLYGILECRLGFTPASGQTVIVTLTVESD